MNRVIGMAGLWICLGCIAWHNAPSPSPTPTHPAWPTASPRPTATPAATPTGIVEAITTEAPVVLIPIPRTGGR